MADKPFFVIPTALKAFTTGNELPNRPALHLGEFYYRGMVWETSGGGSWVEATFDSQQVDFVSVMGANATAATTIRVQVGGHDSGHLPFIDPVIVRDDGKYHSHYELPAPVAASSVRIEIGGHSGSFSASMLVVGKKISPTKYYEPQWERSMRDLGSVTFNRNGVPGVANGDKLRATTFRLAWLNEQEMEEVFSPMDERVGKSSPLYLCFDPAETIYRQRRTFFGFLEDQPAYAKRGWNRFERQFQLLSLF